MKVESGRRLASYQDAVLPSKKTFFHFDGTNSDLARQLYFREKVGDSAEKLTNFDVPDKVQSRLKDLVLDWDELSGIAQRALLWDTGYGYTMDNKPVKIWTLGGHSMADLAVPLVQFQFVGCEEMNCTQPDNTQSLSNLYCNGEQMLNAARCVAEDFEDTREVRLAMWMTGGNPKVVPNPLFRKHRWLDSSSATDQLYSVAAIHTVNVDIEAAYSKCPTDSQNGGYGSLVLPCYHTGKITDEIRESVEEVQGTPWVSRWLAEAYSGTSPQGSGSSSSNNQSGSDGGGPILVVIVPIVGGILLVIGLIVLVVVIVRRRNKRGDANFQQEGPRSPSNPYQAYNNVMPPANNNGNWQSEDVRNKVKYKDALSVASDAETRRYSDLTTRMRPSYDGEFSSESNATMKILLSSEFLANKRIPFDQLSFEKALSKGAMGEVWLGTYHGQLVAIKRLLRSNTHRAEEVEEFAKEIELTASLVHPNIVSFIGVAWNTLNNLVMALEFFPNGDLLTYLEKNADDLSWAKDNIHIAVGIAQAVKYLHACEPPIIHRDLKSKNVMLTNDLEPKVIDFGVSRGTVENTMTSGVGTPYWTAPEILAGKRYTEQADIYSIGVILSELDTGKRPYHDALRPDGKKSKPFQIMERVIAGELRPRFSDDCPVRILRLSTACCQQDPTQRPTAAQVVQMLEG